MNKLVTLSIVIPLMLYALYSETKHSECLPCRNPKTTFVPRSQSTHASRYLVGIEEYINKYNTCDTYGCLFGTFEYTRSFRSEQIADYFWGRASDNGTVTFSGSLSPNRGKYEVLADYFGLPQDFKSEVCFEPQIKNYLFDIGLYVGLDKWAENTYLSIEFPIVHTRWSMQPRENIINSGIMDLPNGYMSKVAIPRSLLPSGVLETFAGGVTFGDMNDPLNYGKIACGELKKTRLSDLHFVLGYNFINNDLAHAGLNIRAAFPTGNKPTGEYLFEPIVGNGGHFELGAGFSSHMLLWESEDRNCSIAAYCDLNLTHLFTSTQVRSFDFKDNDQGSRYILVEEFTEIPKEITSEGRVGNQNNHMRLPGITHEYDGNLYHAVNLTSLCCDVSVKLQGDMAFKLAFKQDCFTCDIGYSFWGRSKECVVIKGELQEDTFGLKGDAFLYGAVAANSSTVENMQNNAPNARSVYPANAIPLSAMQEDKATLFTGGNFLGGTKKGVSTLNSYINPGVDSPAFTEAFNSEVILANVFSPVDPSITGLSGDSSEPPIFTSNPVDFISEVVNLDPESAASPSSTSHTFFMHISYAYDDECGYHPTIGVGGEVEFDRKRKDLGDQVCDCRSSLNQWGIWIKGSITF
ncbi:MAG: hypothetical protein WBQ73_02275 [Candidatus Babeliales bacterium]